MRLYIHIPFCEQKCNYCAFTSYVSKEKKIALYFEKLLFAIEFFLNEKEVKELKSIYIGGGTPSLVDSKFYEPIFQKLSFFMQDECEITIEANPSSLTKEWLLHMKNLGVNRLSLGAQSFDDKKLAFLGRVHNSNEAILALENIFEVGFKNLSVDLIYGTFLDNLNLLESDLKKAITFPITHLSAYTLTIEKNTPFFKKKNIIKKSDDYSKFVKEFLEDRGFNHYEVASFGKVKSKHNLAYWNYEEYIGVGCSAVGFDGKVRYTNTQNLNSYLKNPLNLKYEKIDKEKRYFEKIFLGLRSEIGICKSELLENDLKNAITLLDEGMLRLKDERFYAKDFFIADSLALYIMN